MNKLIVTSSYMGSGSSAFTSLFQELKNCSAEYDSFEFVFLHCPNGLFDLEDKLLIGNNNLRSDEALHSFYKEMKKLYNQKYYWVGNYKEIISPLFMEQVNTFIQEIIQFHPDFYWYVQEETNAKMFAKLVLKKLVSICSFHKIELKKPLRYDELWISYVTPEEFYHAARKFIIDILKDMNIEKQNIVLDQLLLPHNLHRISHYFEDELVVFVVQRDPRDVFLTNKYIWSLQNEPVPFPTEVHSFCQFYKRLRTSEQPVDDKRIHRFHFEDLIYNYDETVLEILSSLNFTKEDHIHPLQHFDPSRSIHNTQLFLNNSEWKKEADIIAQNLSEYIYNFPYEHIPDAKKTF